MYDINNPSMECHFSPPAQSTDIISYNEDEQGRVNSVSLFVVDALNQHFTLRVITPEVSELESRDPKSEAEEEREPEFIVPGPTINPDDLERIVQIPPALLEKYLVPQEREPSS